MTFRQVLQNGQKRLANARILFCDTPMLDASILLAFAAGISKEKLFASYPDEAPAWIIDNFEKLIQKRLLGQPVSYILNIKEFYGRDFYVDETVLIPRPDTEVLVEAALKLLSGNNLRVLDLCTGSGCVGITLKLENQKISVSASDFSKKALKTAAKNAKKLGADINFIHSDLLKNIEGNFDVIVSNPPYLKTIETNKLKEANWAEPDIALDGGKDGLYFIDKIIKQSVVNLTDGGYLLIESGSEQTEKIKELLCKKGFSNIDIIKDIENRNRVTIGKYYGRRISKI